MQKIFKIERVDPKFEFKQSNKSLFKRRRRQRNSKKVKLVEDNTEIEKLIKKQSELHNEEKELLQKKEQMMTTNILDPKIIPEYIGNYPEIENKIKIDSNENLETNESIGFTSQKEAEQQETSSKIFVTSIDVGILQWLQFFENAPGFEETVENWTIQNLLPQRNEATPEYWLVLDLDETLVHWSISPFEGYDEIREWIYISYRPYLIQFLEKVSQIFEVVVFTASEKDYACMVLDRIDPENKYIHHRLFRDSWLPLHGNYIKDLSVLGRDVDKTIIIDNSMIAFALNIDNAIPIESFSGDKSDDELYKLIEIMDQALTLGSKSPNNIPGEAKTESPPNLREYLTSIFRLKERISFWKSQYVANREIGASVSN